ncbi:hypothetical protein C922_05730 [Plasmodium inui San Antonio 1]|uniref:Uncharacterized protein n=1 Tax=Plasmodium inui San Antonio 1 TaxID=1237626 RepID=W7AF30_9APIC|nr:hypothetical protein C922_05730 [Plasmodium inui San Antonio 1]EUD63886.1 hypothetical protein C922_05730 [Plasmodium inui San Antonio 1]
MSKGTYYVWFPSPREILTGTEDCEINPGGKYCYHIPSHTKPYNRINHGVYEWPRTLGIEYRDYSLQKQGFIQGGLRMQETERNVSWEDVIDGILNHSIGSSKNKKNNKTDDTYVGKIESRFWKSFVQNAGKGPCDRAADCQKLLPFIGCVVYWLWGQEERLIKREAKAAKVCEEVKKRMIGGSDGVEIIGDHQWSRIQRGSNSCQGKDQYKKCAVEAISLVLTVANSLKQLCPGCPQTGLDSILGDKIKYGSFPCFRYKTIEGGYEICEGIGSCDNSGDEEGRNCYCDPARQVRISRQTTDDSQSDPIKGPQSPEAPKAKQDETGESRGGGHEAPANPDKPRLPIVNHSTTGNLPATLGEGTQNTKGEKGQEEGEVMNISQNSTPDDSSTEQTDQRGNREPTITRKGELGHAYTPLPGPEQGEKHNQVNPNVPQEVEQISNDRQGGSITGGVIGGVVGLIMFLMSGYGLYRVYRKPTLSRKQIPPQRQDYKIAYMRQ